jgi:ketosteroid isomerase-like protein
MSEENVALVREVMDLMNRATTREAVRELYDKFDPDVRIDMTRRVFNPDVYAGHDGLRRLGSEVSEVWVEFKLEPERFIDAGDRVMVIERRRGRGGASGIEIDQRSAVIWTLRGGKVVAMETDLTPDEAIAAAA